MKWKDVSIAAKLAVGFGLVLVLLILVGYKAVTSTEDVLRGMTATLESFEHIHELRGKEADHLAWSAEISRGVILEDMHIVKAEEDYRQCNFGKWFYGPGRAELEARHPELAPSIHALEEPHKTIHGSYVSMREHFDRHGQAAMPTVRAIYLEETLGALAHFRETLAHLRQEVAASSKAVEHEALASAANDVNLMRYATLAAVVAGLCMAIFLGRAIVHPLRNVVQAADAIATGDLYPHIDDVARKDEMGLLAQAFQRMTLSLQSMADIMEGIAGGDLRQDVHPQSEKDAMGHSMKTMAGNLRELATQMQQAMETVNTSINDISVTTAQLSSSSAETAAAMSETTATIEEVRQTVSLTNQKAAGVSERSRHAASVAVDGKTPPTPYSRP